MLQDRAMSFAAAGHDRCADLAETNAVAPTLAFENERRSLSLDVKCGAI